MGSKKVRDRMIARHNLAKETLHILFTAKMVPLARILFVSNSSYLVAKFPADSPACVKPIIQIDFIPLAKRYDPLQGFSYMRVHMWKMSFQI